MPPKCQLPFDVRNHLATWHESWATKTLRLSQRRCFVQTSNEDDLHPVGRRPRLQPRRRDQARVVSVRAPRGGPQGPPAGSRRQEDPGLLVADYQEPAALFSSNRILLISCLIWNHVIKTKKSRLVESHHSRTDMEQSFLIWCKDAMTDNSWPIAVGNAISKTYSTLSHPNLLQPWTTQLLYNKSEREE